MAAAARTILTATAGLVVGVVVAAVVAPAVAVVAAGTGEVAEATVIIITKQLNDFSPRR